MRKLWIVTLGVGLIFVVDTFGSGYCSPPVSMQPDLTAQIVVHAPHDARIFFDNEPTKQLGPSRLFLTPPLSEGVFAYDVRMEVVYNGKIFWQIKTVDVSPRRLTTVSFNNWMAEATTGEQLVAKVPRLEARPPKPEIKPKPEKPAADAFIRPWQEEEKSTEELDADMQLPTMKPAVARPVGETKPDAHKPPAPALNKEDEILAEERKQSAQRKSAVGKTDDAPARTQQVPDNMVTRTDDRNTEKGSDKTLEKVADLPVTPKIIVPPDRAIVQVHVPDANARISFFGQKMPQKGKVRAFKSPQLSPGIVYMYQIEAVWGERRQRRDIFVQSGKLVTVRFSE